MNPDQAIFWGQQVLMTSAQLCGPVLLAALVVGAGISLIQAVTQIHEMTLVFVPKIIAVFAVFVLMGGWMLEEAMDFATTCFTSIRDVE